MGFFRHTPKPLVGLDIGSSSVKVCELSRVGNGAHARIRLQKVGRVALPPDAIVDGDIMDTNVVAAAIRRALSDRKIKSRDVAIAVSGQQVMIKKVTFPLMSQAELAESVRWEAESFFPAGQGLEAYALDYDLLEERTQEGSMDVVLVACRKDKLEATLSCVAQAGCVPRVVDVDAFALQNAYEASADPEDQERVVALVNLGATYTNLTLLVRGKAVFWRDMAWGGARYADKLMEDWGLDRAAAESLLQGVAVEGSDPEDIQPSIHAVSDAFADELLRTMEFIRTSFKVDQVDRMLLTGGGASAPGLPGILAERLHTRVERLDPFRGLEVDTRTEDPAEVAALGGAAAVAVGLALRREGDR